MIQLLGQAQMQRREVFSVFRERFSGDGGSVETPWMLVVLLVGAVVLAAVIHQWHQQRRTRTIHSPWRLFLQLLWRLPLDWRSRWRLLRLGLHAGRDAPSKILISPSAFAQSAQQWLAARAHKSQFARHHRQLTTLSEQLFGVQLAA